MFRYINFSLIIFSSALFAGCSGQSGSETRHEPGGSSVTQWTENTELFMEYPALIVGQEAVFAVHLSDMKDFKPVIQGKLTCVFKKDGDEPVTLVVYAPSYPGIFRPVVKFKQAGVYDMQLNLEGEQISDVIRVLGVQVYADEASVPHAAAEDTGEELITFLKEQQWKIDFRTEPVRKHKLAASVQALGEILPQAQMHAEVPAPVNGVILVDQNDRLPSVGQWVTKNDVMAVISPPANTETSFNSIRSEYLIASAEYERAQRLFEKKAISQKRLEETKLRFGTRKAGYDVVSRQIDFGTSEKDDGAVAMHFHLKPPIDGIIQEIHFNLGENVQVGETLFTITNPRSVLLKAHVPVARIAQTKNANDASFRIEGYEQEFKVSGLNGRLISIGSIVDEKSRTVPVLFSLNNPENLFKIGMFAEVSVKTGKSVETLAIPNSAIFDDNGTSVAYVHVEGESFAKRALTTGITDNGYTQILNGISDGERVTTVGGYQVRLASLSTSVPSGHGHEH
ncbi:MAG: efflux RND transporter periplasmic adaptor subunit [Calditrichaeota bacterium]|nr:efflux RND transporter periplasmic adaptor subunit [Calditrichota bacterium]